MNKSQFPNQLFVVFSISYNTKTTATIYGIFYFLNPFIKSFPKES